MTMGDEALREILGRFAELLRASPHNLLSPRGLVDLERRHFPESLAFAHGLPEGPRLLDLGSGGGLPGLVIAAARPDLEVHLLEATGKKAIFLAEAAGVLGLNVTVHHGRAEELARGPLAGRFSLVTARAVAPMVRLGPLAAPFLEPGGQLHAIKGDRWKEEMTEGGSRIQAVGLTLVGSPEGPRPSEAQGPVVLVLERRGGVGNMTK